MAKILIIEDDLTLSKLVCDWLKSERHVVDSADTGSDGLEKLHSYEYDCLILDWELPDLSGIEILKKLRSSGRATPTLMLTGKSALSEKTQGLDSGADDYLTKPFHMKELSARLRALMRRSAVTVSNVVEGKGIRLDSASFRVLRGDEEIQLRKNEFALLEFLMRHPDQVFSADTLLNRVWSSESDATIDAITTCVKRLRKRIDREGQPSAITTIHGVGYKFDPGC
jgi:two-component system, OmpR family, response regulator